MIENKLLTDIQNMIDTYNGYIVELQNITHYGSVSDEREKNCLEATVEDLVSIVSRFSKAKNSFNIWWEDEGKEEYSYLSDERIELVRTSYEVAWFNGAYLNLEPVRKS